MTRSADVPTDLLDGLHGDTRAERAALITWLLDRGFTVDQIRNSPVPTILPANRVMGDDGIYLCETELARSVGLEAESLRRLQRAAGLPRVADPDAAVLRRVDAEAAAAATCLIDFGLDVDEAAAVVRVLVEGLSHTAAILRDTGFKVWPKPDESEIEQAQAAEVIATRAAPRIEAMVGGLMLMQIRRIFETEGLGADERAEGRLPGARTIAVAFADLTGFTRLGEVSPPEELAQVASRLADLAHDAVREPVCFVKSIGDAVMLVSPDVAALADVVLTLLSGAAAAGLPQLRAGIAVGPAVSRAGDWFGSSVNLASRVTDRAEPGMVLVAEPVPEVIGAVPTFVWSSIGRRRLRGLPAEMELFRLRRGTSPRE